MSSESSSDGTYDSASSSSEASEISSIPSLTELGRAAAASLRYCDKAFLSPRDGRQLAERVAQSGPTFSLESSGGLIEGMFCGPTYLIV